MRHDADQGTPFSERHRGQVRTASAGYLISLAITGSGLSNVTDSATCLCAYGDRNKNLWPRSEGA